MPATQLQLGDIAVELVLKDIKNVHLTVHPPAGRVRISAPARMPLDTIRVFAVSKLEWIRRQQHRIREQQREPPRKYVQRESHYVWGKRYLLSVVDSDGAPSIALEHDRMILAVRAGTREPMKEAIVAHWYRSQLKAAVPELIASWERVLAVRVKRVFVRQMRTRWGSCNPRARTIRLNTELARRPRECLDYVVFHEMAHLIEPSHNARFIGLMDRFMPSWRFCRETLNRLPIRHTDGHDV
jgi:predicted metal-dependent hydrolase